VIQLTVLNGQQAGRSWVARRFPFVVGRSRACHLALEQDGVWDRHATIHFRPGEGFFVEASPEALLSINGERAVQARLRNGDLIECGCVRLRFWLAAVEQRGLRTREGLTWVALGGLFALQVMLVYWLVG
jgi:hypothetical protein